MFFNPLISVLGSTKALVSREIPNPLYTNLSCVMRPSHLSFSLNGSGYIHVAL